MKPIIVLIFSFVFISLSQIAFGQQEKQSESKEPIEKQTSNENRKTNKTSLINKELNHSIKENNYSPKYIYYNVIAVELKALEEDQLIA